jgi:hypothetical protein
MAVAVERWEAESLENVKENGRTKPLVLSCKQAGRGGYERRPFLVKAMGAPGGVVLASLRNEFLGMLLARELGLRVAGPSLVEIPEDVAAAINMTLKRYGFQVMSGTAVGSAHLPRLVQIGRPVQIPEAAQNEAAAVYAFDLLTQNVDRRLTNPNCALHEGHVFPYDFEMCFSFMMAIGGGGDPVALSGHGVHRDHVFRPILHKLSSIIDLEPFMAGLKRLKNKGNLDALMTAVPEQWREGAKQIRAHILAVASRAGEFRLELMKTLA